MRLKNEVYHAGEALTSPDAESSVSFKSETGPAPSIAAPSLTSGARSESPHWIIVATAHPAKFETIVEPLIGKPVPIPSSLEQILKQTSTYQEIDPDLNFIA